MQVRVLYYNLHRNMEFTNCNLEIILDRELAKYNIFHNKEIDGDVRIYKVPFVEVGPRTGFFTNDCRILKKFTTAEALDKKHFSKETMIKAAEYGHLIPNEDIDMWLNVNDFFSAYSIYEADKLELDFEDNDFNAVLNFRGTACSDRAKDNIEYLINDLKRENILHKFVINSNGDYEYNIPYLIDEDYDGQILMFASNSEIDVDKFTLAVDTIALARMTGTIVEPSVETVDTFETCFAFC